MSFLKIFQRGLQKTKTALLRGIQGLFSDISQWDAESYRKLEAALIATDLGGDISTRMVAKIRERYELGQIASSDDIIAVSKKMILDILQKDEVAPSQLNPAGPTVILVVGVNGSGKTTSIAKLAHWYQQQGKTVLLGAGDTFRAAGVTQLQFWAEKLGCPVVGGKQGGDSAAVAFDAIKAGLQRGVDLIIIDTAGRQHTRGDLMAELGKVKRIIDKALPGAPHETYLTVDASIGSNALVQAREFGKVFPISGLVLTKLDGSGRGGIVVAIRQELGYPVRFVGLGEGLDDLQAFDPVMFTEALFT